MRRLSSRVPVLAPDPDSAFPPADMALHEPDGLLAIGGDLSPRRLLNAYRHGIFPWFSGGQPILWWSPDPRMLFRTGGFRLSSRMRRSARKLPWRIGADTHFEAVIAACAAPRAGHDGSWITPSMQAAYIELHQLGWAHSIEVHDRNALIGGLYGIAIGRMFFAESMYSDVSGASKAALGGLALRLHDWGWPLIDAQVDNPHLRSLGAEAWPRPEFLAAIAALTAMQEPVGSWNGRFGRVDLAQLG